MRTLVGWISASTFCFLPSWVSKIDGASHKGRAKTCVTIDAFVTERYLVTDSLLVSSPLPFVMNIGYG